MKKFTILLINGNYKCDGDGKMGCGDLYSANLYKSEKEAEDRILLMEYFLENNERTSKIHDANSPAVCG